MKREQLENLNNEDGEIIDMRVVGYHNPNHMIYYGENYGWEPMKGE